MIRKTPFDALATLIASLLLSSLLGAAELTDKVDWPAFMARHDMTWNRLPKEPREAPHLGNGMVGSMVMANIQTRTIRIPVYRSDVNDHRDDSWGWTAYSRPRLMIGEFQLTTVGALIGCQLKQDLWNAELTGTITTDKGTIHLRHFVHADDHAIVTELKPDAGEAGCKWSWQAFPAVTTRLGLPNNENERKAFIKTYGEIWQNIKIWEPNPAGRQEERDGVSVWVQDLLVGGQYATAWQERTATDGTRTHIVSVEKTYPERVASDTAVATVKASHAKPMNSWRQAHQQWWHEYYKQSFVSLPETRLESAYWWSVFRWAASARAGRGYMDTSGIWFQGGGWPYTTMNFNIQSCLWGVYAANRLNVGASLVEALHRNQQNLIDNVPNPEWRKDSAFVGRVVAPDFRGGETKHGEPEVGLLTWTLHNAWLQYRYSMDESILRETLYPLLRRSVNYYRHLAVEGKDGLVHLPETFSPESGAFPDCNFDLSLFRWGIETLLRSAERLKIDDPLIPVWKDLAKRLVPFPSDAQGFRFGATRAFDGSHRHASHLLMIYPLNVVTIDQPEWRDAIHKSALSYGACDSRLVTMAGLQASPIAAVSGFPELAYNRIQWHNDDLSPAGFGDSSGWCMEGAVAIANSIQLLMLQSHGDRIRVFPAMPTAWQDATFRDLRTEGAFLVSARREKGKTRWVQIQSLAGEPCRVETSLIGKPRIIGGSRGVKLADAGNGLTEISLARGESVLLAGDEEPGAIKVEALPAIAEQCNTFGVNTAADAYRAARFKEYIALTSNTDPLLEWAGFMLSSVTAGPDDWPEIFKAAPSVKGSKAKGTFSDVFLNLFRRFGNPVRPALQTALEHPATRDGAIAILGASGNTQELEMISRLLPSFDASARRQVLKAMGARRKADICPVLKQLSQSASNQNQRNEVSRAFINAAKYQPNPAVRTQILDCALEVTTDEALRKELRELRP